MDVISLSRYRYNLESSISLTITTIYFLYVFLFKYNSILDHNNIFLWSSDLACKICINCVSIDSTFNHNIVISYTIDILNSTKHNPISEMHYGVRVIVIFF